MKMFLPVIAVLLQIGSMKAEEMLSKSSSRDGVTFVAKYLPSYRSTGEVWVEYSIINESDRELRAYKANPETFDMHIELFAPNGDHLLLVEDLPGSIPRGGSRHHIAIGGKDSPFQSSVNLSRYYELKSPGRYRCRIRKTCYVTESGWEQRSSSLKPGPPTQVSSEEFVFEVLEIDKAYEESLKKAAELRNRLTKLAEQSAQDQIPAKMEARSPSSKSVKVSETKPTAATPSEEPTSSTPWSVIAILIVAAIGLLWLLLKNRK